MTTKRLSHPLKRYSPPSPRQEKECARIAPQLIDSRPGSLERSLHAVIAFSKLFFDCTRNTKRTAEAVEIELLAWRIAMGKELRKLNYHAPDARTTQVLQLGDLLHRIPVRYGKESTLLCIAESCREHISLDHVTRLIPGLLSFEGKVSSTEICDVINTNHCISMRVMSIVVRERLTPKQVEVAIGRELGKPTAGRPKRAKRDASNGSE